MNKFRTAVLAAVLFFVAAIFLLARIRDIYTILPGIFPPPQEATIIKLFSFDDKDSLKEWKEKVFKDRVNYVVEPGGVGSYVHATSDKSCSAMYYQIKLDANRRPFISWKWRVAAFPNKTSKEDLSSKTEDDFAARLYVIFPALFFTDSKVLEYVWAKDLAPDTIASSPYSDNIKIIVGEAGEKSEWILEERDIYKDYVDAFHARPQLAIGAIAFMCDSDSTKTSADASFDEIKIYYKR
jgi:preprotein translocase subunit SecG